MPRSLQPLYADDYIVGSSQMRHPSLSCHDVLQKTLHGQLTASPVVTTQHLSGCESWASASMQQALRQPDMQIGSCWAA
jgi:hypothetical protein